MANLKLESNGAALDKNGFIQNYPVGTIIIRVNSTIDDGWLLCDGRYVNTSDYPELDAHIGTAYGARVGGTFRLPPLVYNATNNPQNRIPFSTVTSESSYPNNFFHSHTISVNSTSFNSVSHTHNAPYYHGSTTDVNIGHRSVSNSDNNSHAHNSSGNTNTSSSVGGSEPTRAAGPAGPYASGASGQTAHTHGGAAWSGTSGAGSDNHAHFVNWHSLNLSHYHNHNTTTLSSVTHNVSPGTSANLPSAQYPPSREVYFLIKT
jgi:microcystin-dependent protein